MEWGMCAHLHVHYGASSTRETNCSWANVQAHASPDGTDGAATADLRRWETAGAGIKVNGEGDLPLINVSL